MNGIGNEILRVEGLVKYFPVRRTKAFIHAVNNVSFEFHAGTTFAIVGESGSGKTTVGRCILKLMEPTSGRIFFKGVAITTLRQAEFQKYRSRIQMVFQEPFASLNPRMSIMRIIEENLTLEGLLSRTRRSEQVSKLLDMVHLSRDFLDRYPHELTGGQQQRVAIARAISTNPDLVVLDEPTSELDITVRAEIINLLRNLQTETGAAYMFISHDLTAVREISDRVAIMYLGEIIEVASNPEIFDLQLHPYGQALLASVLFPDPDREYADIILSGEIPSPIDLPSGCFLHPRCPFAEDVCSVEHPFLRSFPDDRLAACHFAERFLPNQERNET